MSLEDYFNHDDGTENCYELENGELLIMPPESDRNICIATFLRVYFAQLGIPYYRLRIGTEVVVSGMRATVRKPFSGVDEELARRDRFCHSFNGDIGYATAAISRGSGQSGERK